MERMFITDLINNCQNVKSVGIDGFSMSAFENDECEYEKNGIEKTMTINDKKVRFILKYLPKCVKIKDYDSAKNLLENGYNDGIDYQWSEGDSLIHMVSQLGDINMLKLLLKYGANPDILNHDGVSTLQVADSLMMVMLLSKHKQQFNAADRIIKNAVAVLTSFLPKLQMKHIDAVLKLFQAKDLNSNISRRAALLVTKVYKLQPKLFNSYIGSIDPNRRAIIDKSLNNPMVFDFITSGMENEDKGNILNKMGRNGFESPTFRRASALDIFT
eukprot:TRINITY_DN6614_c0_g1_i1.p1 TRINITY_DN6614_c0_g1~~TRINITY_DN6614_c0_g1_i1.p1  ORF type:complete len:303 (+),score=43.97 TRINITY_DN6614_c0_g1_i1:96-911(+)